MSREQDQYRGFVSPVQQSGRLSTVFRIKPCICVLAQGIWEDVLKEWDLGRCPKRIAVN